MAAGRRIFLAYLVYFGAIGAAYPYLPVFYRDLGLTFEEIGILTAIQAGHPARPRTDLGRADGSLPAGRARRCRRRPRSRRSAASSCSWRRTSQSVLAGSMLLFAGLAGIGPTLDARTLETLGPKGRDRYGQVRAFGSLAFVIVALLVGLLLEARGSRVALLDLPAVPDRHGPGDRHHPPARARRARSACSAARARSWARPGMLLFFVGLHDRLDRRSPR